MPLDPDIVYEHGINSILKPPVIRLVCTSIRGKGAFVVNMSAQLKYSLDKENSRMERFVQLYARHQQYLFSYVLALVPKWADAENVAESTQLVLWRKFEQYQEGTSFLDVGQT